MSGSEQPVLPHRCWFLLVQFNFKGKLFFYCCPCGWETTHVVQVNRMPSPWYLGVPGLCKKRLLSDLFPVIFFFIFCSHSHLNVCHFISIKWYLTVKGSKPLLLKHLYYQCLYTVYTWICKPNTDICVYSLYQTVSTESPHISMWSTLQCGRWRHTGALLYSCQSCYSGGTALQWHPSPSLLCKVFHVLGSFNLTAAVLPISTLRAGHIQRDRIHGNAQLSKTSTIHAE